MSQQPLNLRRSVQIVRRHKRLFGAVVVLGLLIGAAYAVLKPPMLTSSALVVLPQLPATSGQTASSSAGGGAGTDIDTQIVIAGSDAVLAKALPHVSPAMSLQALENNIKATSLTGNIISIAASGKTAAQAETTANAVASSYVAYVSAADSPVGRVLARILQPAANATGAKLPTRIAIYGLLGALAGALVGFIISLVIGHNDRRLRERDPIANSVGLPVLASFPVEHPSDAVGWARLLEEYEPGPVHAWRLRATLQQLGMTEAAPGNGAGGVPSVTIVSFASDPGALALGPQLASFGASLGIPTALVIGPQQDANATATLRTAGAAAPHDSERMRHLRVFVSDDGDISVPRGAGLIVVVAVVDSRTPRMPETARTAVTVLGVSAGVATAEQLARAATAAAADGREVIGILVADPDPDDQTTGRIPNLAPPARRPLPTRVNDMPTEIRR
jgi:capsular polysaccharide biosynthesis protein